MDEYEAARKEEKQREADEIAALKRKRVGGCLHCVVVEMPIHVIKKKI